MNKYPVTIIIVSWNSEAWIERCLNAALKNNPEKILVIDNNSQDKTCSIIEEKFEEIELIKLNQNYGFSVAMNMGFKQSQSPYDSVP